MRARTFAFSPLGASLLVWAALGVVVASPAEAQILLNTNDGFLYDIADTGENDGGQLVNGTAGGEDSSAYAGAYFLDVAAAGAPLARYSTNNTPGSPRPPAARVRVLADWTVPGTETRVHREVYVPPTEGEYARYLDVFENDAGSDVTLRVRYSGRLGDRAARVRLTADGNVNSPASNAVRDDLARSGDLWVLQDDGDARGIPSIVTLIRGPESQFDRDLAKPVDNADLFRFVEDQLAWEYEITVPAGETRVLMMFALQAQDRETAIAEADRLSGLPEDTLIGVPEEYYDEILNWRVGGIPRIVMDGPVSIDEGQAVRVAIEVDDLDDRPVTWSVDVPTMPGQSKGDGDFAEGDDVGEMVVPRELTDGDSQYKLFVRARYADDPTRERIRAHVVQVNNVAPRITSLAPRPTLFVGSTYVYDIRVEDAPAEFASPTPIGFGVGFQGDRVNRPDGMELPVPMTDEDGEPFGRLIWEVQRDQRNRSFDLTVVVNDASGAEDTEDFTLRVSDNLPPDPPVIVAPLPLTDTDPGPVRLFTRQPELVVENAPDPEEDDVRYHFRVSSESDFAPREAIVVQTQRASETPLLFETGIEEDPAGETSWQVAQALELGTYFWEVRAIDEEGAVSQARFGVFNIRPPESPDAGPPPPPPMRSGSDGCAVGRGAAARAPATLGLALVGLALAARRRRGD